MDIASSGISMERKFDAPILQREPTMKITSTNQLVIVGMATNPKPLNAFVNGNAEGAIT